MGPLSRSCHPLIVRELPSACYRTQVRSADFGVAHNFRWELPGSWCHGLKIWKTRVFDPLGASSIEEEDVNRVLADGCDSANCPLIGNH